MRPPSLVTHRSIQRSKTFASFAAAAVFVCAVLVLAGWTFGVEGLTSLLPGLPPMKANTAICLGLLAAAIFTNTRTDVPPRWLILLPSLAGSIAVLSIGETWLATDFAIDQLLFFEATSPDNPNPGRMAPFTGIAIVLLAIAIPVRSNARLPLLGRQMCAILPFVSGMLAVVGHAYGVHYIPNATSPFATMAVPTALSIMALGLASLAAEPGAGILRVILADRVGGRFARLLLPLAILFPVAVGWLRLLGQDAGLYGTNFGVLMMVLVAILVLSVIAVLSARWLNRSEEELLEGQHTLERRVQERTVELETTVTQLRAEIVLREAAEAAHAESRALFQNALDFAPIGMAVLGLDGHWLRVNRALCSMVGYSEQELLQLTFQDITHPDDLDADLAQVRKLIDGGIPSYQMEKRYFRKNREMVWVMLSVSLVRDGQNKPLYFVAQIEDISARRKVMQALEGSRKLLTEVIAALPIPFVLKADDTRWLMVNDAMAKYSAKPIGELIGKTDLELFGPELASVYRAEDDKVLTSDETIVIDGKNITASGAERWVLKHKRGIRLPDGTRMVTVTVTDISDHRQTEQRLLDSEERFRSLTTLSSDWYWEQDDQYRTTYMSPRYSADTGMAMKSTLGQTRFETDNIWESEQQKREHRETLDARLPFRDLQLSRRDDKGELHHMSISGKPVFDDARRFTGYRGVGRDVTKQRRAEKALRASEERFRKLTAMSADWYWEQDEKFRFTNLAGTILDAVGLPAQSVLGKTRWELPYASMTDADWAEHRALLEKHLPFRDLVLMRDLDDGTRRYVTISGQPIFGESGRFEGYRGVGRDISAQKRADKELADSRRFLSEVIDAIPIPLTVKDDQRRLIIVNNANNRFHGRAPHEIVGKLDTDLYPPERVKQFWAEDDAVLESGEPLIEEQAFTTMSGELRWVIKQKRRIVLPDGRRWLVATLLDITNRKRAEAALAEREAWLRLVTDNSAACIGYIDTEQRFRFCNSTYQKWYGIPVEAMLGKSIRELIGEREYAQVEPAYLQALRGDRANYERTIALEGRKRSIFVDLIPDTRTGGAVAGAFIYSVDITSRVESEEALQKSEERFQIVVRGTDDGIWDWNLETGVCYFSPRYKKMLGYEDSEFPDVRDSFEAHLHAEDRIPTIAALKTHFEQHEPYEVEYRLRNKSGEYRWFQGRGQATWDDAGSPVRFSGALRDITQRKQSELDLAESRRFLADLIDAIPIPITVKDESHRFVIVNAAMGRFLGRSPADLQGKFDADFFPPERVKVMLAEDDAVLATGVPFVTEQPYLTISKESRWVLKHKRRIISFDGKRWVISALLDITLRKQGELEVERSQKFLESVIDAIPQPVFVKDSQHRWVLLNGAFCELLGHQRAELLGRSDPDIFPADWVERVWAEDDQVLSGSGVVIAGEADERRADGSVRWLLKSKKRVTLPDESKYIVGISMDITRLKQVEEALRKSDELHRLLAENSNDLISLLDPTGIIEYASQAAVALLDTQPEQLIGKLATDLLHPDDVSRALQIFADIVKKQVPVVFICRLMKSGGTWSWIESSFRAIRDAESGRTRQVILVSRDINERVRVSNALNHFKYVLDNTLDMIFIYDAQTLRFNYVNEGAARALGIPRERLLGIAPWDLRTDILEKDYFKFIEPFQRGEIQSRQVETVFRRGDGTLMPVEETMQLIRQPDEVDTFISVARDLTERKRIEQMKNDFVSTVSHELRTPVTSIRGSLGLLAGGVAGRIPKKALRLIEIANSNSERLIRLINDILDIQKIESGKMRFAMRPVALRGLLETPLAENRGYAEQFGVRFVVRGVIPDVTVRVDPDRIMQVMANLLSNAAKFSPRGSDVEIAADAFSASVRISVTDHGSGIPLEFQSRIFGKFSQADASDSRKMGGSGLGLSIAKSIVEKHSGTVNFSSAPGRTTFFFDLPLALVGHREGDATGSVSDPVVN